MVHFPAARWPRPFANRDQVFDSGLDEAHAYLAHPLLGDRLVQCTRAINVVRNRTAHEIFGSLDDLKLHSSMTLFRETANDPEPFRTAIERYFGGEADARTLALLKEGLGRAGRRS